MNDQDGEPFNPSTPGEWTRERSGRTIVCPRCRHQFESMRRFQMACPACGYEWEEDSVLVFRRSPAARIEGVKELIVRIFVYAGPVLLALFFIFMFVRILANGWGRIGQWDTLVFGLIILSLTALAYAAGRFRSYHGPTAKEMGMPVQPELYTSRANDPGQTIDNSQS